MEPHHTFAAAIGAALGNEEIRRRWLATHVVRNYALATDDALLPAVWAATKSEEDLAPFLMSECLVPYLTSRFWLLVALSQISLDRPSALGALLGELLTCAESKVFPHAGIRELARRAVNNAQAASTFETTAEDRQALLFANRPISCSTADQGYGTDERDAGDTEFHFSSMDTVPYWFAPLARTFANTSTTDIARHADTWITGHWNRSWDADCKLDQRAVRRKGGYELVSNDHGSIPVVETAQTYLEFHSMHLAAGTLIDTRVELSKRPYSDEMDPWLEWLDSYLPPTTSWSALSRGVLPAHPYASGSWQRLLDRDEVGGFVPTELDVEAIAREALQAPFDISPLEALTVYASISVSRRDIYSHVNVDTALISPGSAAALLNVLGKSQHHLDIPTVEDKSQDTWSAAVTLPGIALRGWLTRQEREVNTLDSHDPRSCGAQPDRASPDLSGDVMRWAALGHDRTGGRREADETRGHCLYATRRRVLELLARENMSLLIKTTSTAHASDRPGTESTSYHRAAKYRVLSATGEEMTTVGIAEAV
jgi:hypothetical protein